MSILDIVIAVVVFLLIMLFMYFWTKFDLENKSNSVLIDPKTGKIVSRFRDWISGKEEELD